MPDQQALSIPLGSEEPVRCPRCHSDEALHFDEITLIDPEGDVVPLHADGVEGLSVVTATIGDAAAPGRRHLIVLPHWCAACGARGEILLQQENGRTVGRYREVAAS